MPDVTYETSESLYKSTVITDNSVTIASIYIGTGTREIYVDAYVPVKDSEGKVTPGTLKESCIFYRDKDKRVSYRSYDLVDSSPKAHFEFKDTRLVSFEEETAKGHNSYVITPDHWEAEKVTITNRNGNIDVVTFHPDGSIDVSHSKFGVDPKPVTGGDAEQLIKQAMDIKTKALGEGATLLEQQTKVKNDQTHTTPAKLAIPATLLAENGKSIAAASLII